MTENLTEKSILSIAGLAKLTRGAAARDENADVLFERNGQTLRGVFRIKDILELFGAVDKDTFEDVVRAHVQARVGKAMEARGQYWVVASDHQRLVDELRRRTGQAEAKLAECDAERGRLHAETIRLEGIIAAVRRRLENADGEDLKVRLYNRLQEDLNGQDAPFELPTEPGVRFTAKRVGNLAHTSEFVTLSDAKGNAFYFIPEGDGYTTETDRVWPGDRVMRDWTDHRILEVKP